MPDNPREAEFKKLIEFGRILPSDSVAQRDFVMLGLMEVAYSLGRMDGKKLAATPVRGAGSSPSPRRRRLKHRRRQRSRR